jgi:hypothetical protein
MVKIISGKRISRPISSFQIAESAQREGEREKGRKRESEREVIHHTSEMTGWATSCSEPVSPTLGLEHLKQSLA